MPATQLTQNPATAATFLRRGQLVAFPTETVYGLGAAAHDEAAVSKIFAAKGRPSDNPLIVHVADTALLDRITAARTQAAQRLMAAFFPGPLTLVLPRHPDVPAQVTGGLPTVGVRVPRHPLALAFLRACACPVAAPSANRSGRPSATTWEAVHEDLGGRIACILQSEATEMGLESTVVDCTTETPIILRAGAVTLAQLRTVVPATRLAAAAAEQARSPGTRYRHYAPRASVVLFTDPPPPTPEAGRIGLSPPKEATGWGASLVCESVQHYAQSLFAFFRHCERLGLTTIYAEAVPPVGLGLALMDRLRRAAAATSGG